jgi:hypothetical protein
LLLNTGDSTAQIKSGTRTNVPVYVEFSGFIRRPFRRARFIPHPRHLLKPEPVVRRLRWTDITAGYQQNPFPIDSVLAIILVSSR